jgi:hypothetical protein
LQKDGKRESYAPLSHPGLSEKLETSLQHILGSTVFKPVVEAYRSKLRSSAAAQHTLPSPERETPPFLRIVATPDTNQANRLEAELIPVAILKYEVVEEFLGSMAHTITTKPASVF